MGLVMSLGFVAACGTGRITSQSTSYPRPLQANGITNFFELSTNVYSGSAPEGDSGFRALEDLGVRTLISVDGAPPDAEMAAAHGLRYVHIPVTYDGITRSNSLLLVKAVQTLPGPVFIHCHHGQHRGPTAAAVVCEALERLSPAGAENWLRLAGTATNYPGLYRTVREFTTPTAEELYATPANFSARAHTPDLVSTMVEIDKHFDDLKHLAKNQFKPYANDPGKTSASESLLLLELFREAIRNGQGRERGTEFVAKLGVAETRAETLHEELLRFGGASYSATNSAAALSQMSRMCADCHQKFRN